VLHYVDLLDYLGLEHPFTRGERGNLLQKRKQWAREMKNRQRNCRVKQKKKVKIQSQIL